MIQYYVKCYEDKGNAWWWFLLCINLWAKRGSKNKDYSAVTYWKPMFLWTVTKVNETTLRSRCSRKRRTSKTTLTHCTCNGAASPHTRIHARTLKPVCTHTHTRRHARTLKPVEYFHDIKEETMTFSWLKRVRVRKQWKAECEMPKLICSAVQRRGRWTKGQAAEENLVEGPDGLHTNQEEKSKGERGLHEHALTMSATLFSVLRVWTHSLPQQTRRHGAYIAQVRKLGRDTENPAQAAWLVERERENWVSEATLPKPSCSWRGSGETWPPITHRRTLWNPSVHAN